MSMQILTHTPVWVWGILVVLVVLGLVQARTRRLTIQRVSLVPLVMLLFSFYGCISAFGVQVAALLLWLLAGVLVAAWLAARPLPAGTGYDAVLREFVVPGSWLPMGLMMAMFCAKYVAGVSLALHPALRQESAFVSCFAAFYGAISGIFLGRAVRLWRLPSQRGHAGLPCAAE
jgi:hypothetical protein